MGPGMGLIVAVPFLVATLSLLWLFRRERHRREAGLPASRVFRFYQAIAAVILVLVGLEVVGLVYVALTERPARQPEPLATWPVAPEVLASPVSSGLPPNFDGGGWALDPSFGAPGPATTT